MIDQMPHVSPTILQADRRPMVPVRSARFTGGGKRLMIGVLATIGLLLIAAIGTVGWMLHAAFEAASRQETAREERAVPPPPASTNPADWITADDYPLDALRNGEEGIVALRWRVGPEGRVHDCTVTASSGHASLDRAACRAIVRSGRYPPAAPGDPQLTFTRRVIWKIPK